MKYFLYARKSEEDKNRQVQSIETQIQQLSQRHPDLTIVDVYKEAKTAKEPGRPLFNEMVARIQRGEAHGILVWSINRLLRNPVDQGTIQWMLQRRQLLSIQTMDKEHTPDDNVLILNVESGVANQFIIDLTKGTLRGLDAKVDGGWFPHRAPEGYLNDTHKEQGQRDIIIDPMRFPLLRRAWDMMLTGNYTVPQILRDLNTSGYRSKPHAKSLSEKMSRSALYRIFNNRFYAGWFLHNGTWHAGKHTPMVSLAEFTEVQRLLGKSTRIAPRKNEFTFAGMIRCGRCGCQIVAEKKKRDTALGEHIYIYYHCTNARGICNTRSVTEDDLQEQIFGMLPEITIRPKYRDLLFYIWRTHYDHSQERDNHILEQQQQVLLGKRKERDRLLSLRLQDMIDDHMFREKKAELDMEIQGMEIDAHETASVLDGKVEIVENILLFATEPKDRFREMSQEERRTIAMHLGAQYTLTDRKLTLELNELLVPVRENARQFEADLTAFEQTAFGSESNKKEALDRLVSVWGPTWDVIRKKAVQARSHFPLLKLV